MDITWRLATRSLARTGNSILVLFWKICLIYFVKQAFVELLSIFSNCKKISNRKDIEKYRKWFFFLVFSLHKWNIFDKKVGKESRKSCIKRHCIKNVFQSKRGAKRISHGNSNNQLVSIYFNLVFLKLLNVIFPPLLPWILPG